MAVLVFFLPYNYFNKYKLVYILTHNIRETVIFLYIVGAPTTPYTDLIANIIQTSPSRKENEMIKTFILFYWKHQSTMKILIS